MPRPYNARNDVPNPEQIAQVRRFARRTAWFLDSSIRIPFVGLRIGVQPIVSLIPVAGDVAGFVVTLAIIGQAVRMKAPPATLARMGGYAVLDLFVGLVPVAGDAVDFFLKANTRNCALLERHLDDLEGKPVQPPWKRRLGVVLLIAGLIGAGWLAWALGSAVIGALFG